MKTKLSIALVLLLSMVLVTFIWKSNDKIDTTNSAESIVESPNLELPNENSEKPKKKSLKEKRLEAIDALAVNEASSKFAPMPRYLNKSMSWLAKAQLPDGGWGAGNHNNQQNRNPKRVKADPATTAFTAMALVRGGNTLEDGSFSPHLNKALVYLIEKVEASDEESSNITNMKGTQPQKKLGENIDVAMTLQLLNKVYPMMNSDHELFERVDDAINTCIGKLQVTQLADGSWNGGGWAPVLNSAMVNNALEMSKDLGREVDEAVIEKSKDYQAQNYDERGIKTDKAAGVALYAYSSTQRATAKDAGEVNKLLKEADIKPGRSGDQEAIAFSVLNKKYDKEKARKMAKSYSVYNASTESLRSDEVLSGFGNNGGEEYLSYAMASESLFTAGNEREYRIWINKMSNLFAKTQNANGSWSGHHCITSPVFCTAAVVMAMTADRDAFYLKDIIDQNGSE